MKEKNSLTEMAQEENVLLPDGYEEGADLFENGKAQRAAENKKTEQAVQKDAGELRRELRELLENYPALREKLARGEKLPGEVITRYKQDGVPLRAAYAEYELKEAKIELEQLRREVAILRQNAAAAAKAPVRGASGSTDIKGRDPFIEGFLSVD